MSLADDEALKRIERFRDDLIDLHKHWDNRLVLEQVSCAEAYINNRLEIVVYGTWSVEDAEYHWLCRIRADLGVRYDDPSAHRDIDVGDGGDGDGRDKQVVFVVVVQDMERPQLLVRSTWRAYLIEKTFCGSGKGLFYRVEGRFSPAHGPVGGYEVFPIPAHWEMDLTISRDAGGQMIQCAPQVVESISDDECQRLGDWLRGAIHKDGLGRLHVSKAGAWLSDIRDNSMQFG